ncbi:ras guanine nucleotide exchange factor domain-containing protein, partial [Mycena amicta]
MRFEGVPYVMHERSYDRRHRLTKVLVAFIPTIDPNSTLCSRISAFASANLISQYQEMTRKALRDLSRPVVLPRGVEPPDVCNLEPQEFAVALTLIHSDARKKIRLGDYLVHDAGGSGIISEMLIQQEKLIFWLKHLILRPRDTNERIKEIKRLIKTAKRCSELSNYHALAALAAALKLTDKPLVDLTQTRKALSSSSRQYMEYLAETLSDDDHYAEYRRMTRKSERNKITIPWLVAELDDVKRTLARYPKSVPHASGDTVNFERYLHVAKKIHKYEAVVDWERNLVHIAYIQRELQVERIEADEEKVLRDRKKKEKEGHVNG